MKFRSNESNKAKVRMTSSFVSPKVPALNPKPPKSIMVETDTGSISVTLKDIISVEITGNTVLIKYYSGQRIEIGYNRLTSAQLAFGIIDRAHNRI